MTDLDTLKTAYRDSDSGDQSAHLLEERWEKLACDELSPGDREAAIDHILACAQCTDTYRALQILQSEATDFDPALPIRKETKMPRSRRGLWGGVGFLALAAAVMMAIVLPNYGPETPDSTSGTQVLRSAAQPEPATAMAPADVVIEWESNTSLTLRWKTHGPPLPSVVEVLDSNGELIWTSPETTATEIEWPKGIAGNPGRYYWRVVATGSGDKKVSSALVSFEIAPTGVSASRP